VVWAISKLQEYRLDGTSHAVPGYVLSLHVPPRETYFSRIFKVVNVCFLQFYSLAQSTEAAANDDALFNIIMTVIHHRCVHRPCSLLFSCWSFAQIWRTLI
jgi:hypothetical protein